MRIYELLKGLKYAPYSLKPNMKKIPINVFRLSDESMERFNEIYQWLLNNVDNYIQRTQSGGISYSRKNFKPPMWDIEGATTWLAITFIDFTGMWRIQFRFEATEKDNKKQQYGGQSFRAFTNKCAEYGINLANYTIDNGAEVKKEIEKVLIKLANPFFRDKTYNNVHHIDFHNSFPAGLVNTHPEFEGVVTELYNKRKENEVYKAVLNHTIGYMQSIKCCNAKWAHLSRDAINDNNRRLRELAKILEKNGRTIISYNTDGIWYLGDVYHGEGEGKGLGQWENDHINCQFRAKSGGAYEYIEDGTYHAVVRGHTKLDDKKPREQWNWGDIYQKDAEVIQYKWIEGYGLIKIDLNEGEFINDKLQFTV